MKLEKGAYIPEEPHEKHSPPALNPVPPFDPVTSEEKDTPKSLTRCQEYI
jgi:hypothetical protein